MFIVVVVVVAVAYLYTTHTHTTPHHTHVAQYAHTHLPSQVVSEVRCHKVEIIGPKINLEIWTMLEGTGSAVRCAISSRPKRVGR